MYDSIVVACPRHTVYDSLVGGSWGSGARAVGAVEPFASPNAKDTNMLVSFALGDANVSCHPTQNPNPSQWNIGCVGSQTQFFALAMYISCLFVSISFAFDGQR